MIHTGSGKNSSGDFRSEFENLIHIEREEAQVFAV